MEHKNSSKYILNKLISFSVPLIMSGLLQQLFNWVDALIVGNILGESVLAGVGATASMYNMFVTVLVGFSSGLSVLFAQQFGEGKYQNNARLLATYSAIFTVCSAAISIVGITFIVPILELMDTPGTLFDYAKDYLLIIFMGIPFLAAYNVFSAALRGMGNSKVPFVAVLIASATNVVLDYVFIVFFELGVQGAAAATVISQIAMTAYIVLYTVTRYPQLRFSPLRIFQHPDVIIEGGKYGMPPAVQSSVSSIGNLVLQKFMNSFGEQTVAAITTAYRVDSVLLLPIHNLSTAIATLVAQETGAGNKETARKIVKLGSVLMSVMSLLLTAAILFTGQFLLSIFGLTDESIGIGTKFFETIAMFYIVYGLSMSIKGYLEGTSDLLFSGIIGICALGVRILCSYLFQSVWDNMVVAYAEAFSWIFLLIAFTLRYFYKKRRACST